jgi:hypothetical protein
MSTTTYRVECAGFEVWGLVSLDAVQAFIDQLKTKSNVKGEQVRIYRFVNGVRKGGTPDRVGVLS